VKPPPPIAKIVGTRPARRAPWSGAGACPARRAPDTQPCSDAGAPRPRRSSGSGGKGRSRDLRRAGVLDRKRQLDDVVADRLDAIGARRRPRRDDARERVALEVQSRAVPW